MQTVSAGSVVPAAGGVRWLAGVGFGLLNVAALFGVGWILWFVLLHPNGVLALYTPMYGFSLVVAFVAAVVLVANVAECWPLHDARASRPLRGAALTAIAAALTAAMVYGVLWGFIGKYGITYFSPQAIIAAGGAGAELFNARENASTAAVYLFTAFIWIALVWNAGFGSWPWGGVSVGVRAWSRFATVALVSAVMYAVLFHPHVTQLFYPAQIMAGAPPWWAEWAQTSSAYFNMGWVLCAVSVSVVSQQLWDGEPWRRVGAAQGFARGVSAFAGTFALGAVLFAVSLQVMNTAWGEPFQGGQYTDAPYFRYLHAGELAGFLVLSAFVVRTYFGGLRWGSASLTAVVRTALAVGLTAALRAFYYSGAANWMLGKVEGIAQPEDTPLVWTLLLLSLVLVQRELFQRWPL